MDIAGIAETLRQDAPTVVFVNVLLQQVGLPVPAVPTLLLAGSLAAGWPEIGAVLVAAVLASVIADALWYLGGRLFGYRMLAGLCALSINPSSCVSQTEARFVRWGVASLVVAKFVPGFAVVAPPIAGALRMRLAAFLLAAAAGAALWAGLAIVAGRLLQDTVQAAIALLDAHTAEAAITVGLLLAAWLAWKWRQRQRFHRLAALPHIAAEELLAAMDSAQAPLLLDLRGPLMIAEAGPIPGARAAELDRLAEVVGDWPKAQPIVTMCNCPEDASAIQAARRLLEAGYLSVRPVRGGYTAWLAAQGD